MAEWRPGDSVIRHPVTRCGDMLEAVRTVVDSFGCTIHRDSIEFLLFVREGFDIESVVRQLDAVIAEYFPELVDRSITPIDESRIILLLARLPPL